MTQDNSALCTARVALHIATYALWLALSIDQLVAERKVNIIMLDEYS